MQLLYFIRLLPRHKHLSIFTNGLDIGIVLDQTNQAEKLRKNFAKLTLFQWVGVKS